MYQPWAATSASNLRREPRLTYPGIVDGEDWDRDRVAPTLARPLAWADAQGVPRNRMVAAEFGCVRRLPFCPAYLEDVLDALDGGGVHWAFYAFREDAWDGYDYELGDRPVDPRYWSAIEKGEPDRIARDPSAATFAPILRRLRR